MEQKIENIKSARQFLLDQIAGMTTGQLNQIPQGFNNNIIWNLAHLISGQQGIFYARAGLPITVEERYYSPYRPNTKPAPYIDGDEIGIIKSLFISTITQLQTDWKQGLFDNYPSWSAMPYGIEIADVEDALDFLTFHDGLHTGYIMAQKRLVLG
jgi:hypothetical protein